MDYQKEIDGLWWWPDTPEERFIGKLKVGGGNLPSLTLTVQSGARVEREPTPEIMHGISGNGSPVSILHPSLVRARTNAAVSTYDLSAGHAIVGDEVKTKNAFHV